MSQEKELQLDRLGRPAPEFMIVAMNKALAHVYTEHYQASLTTNKDIAEITYVEEAEEGEVLLTLPPLNLGEYMLLHNHMEAILMNRAKDKEAAEILVERQQSST